MASVYKVRVEVRLSASVYPERGKGDPWNVWSLDLFRHFEFRRPPFVGQRFAFAVWPSGRFDYRFWGLAERVYLDPTSGGYYVRLDPELFRYHCDSRADADRVFEEYPLHMVKSLGWEPGVEFGDEPPCHCVTDVAKIAAGFSPPHDKTTRAVLYRGMWGMTDGPYDLAILEATGEPFWLYDLEGNILRRPE